MLRWERGFQCGAQQLIAAAIRTVRSKMRGSVPSARSLNPAARGVQGAAKQLEAEQSARLEVRLCT